MESIILLECRWTRQFCLPGCHANSAALPSLSLPKSSLHSEANLYAFMSLASQWEICRTLLLHRCCRAGMQFMADASKIWACSNLCSCRSMTGLDADFLFSWKSSSRMCNTSCKTQLHDCISADFQASYFKLHSQCIKQKVAFQESFA